MGMILDLFEVVLQGRRIGLIPRGAETFLSLTYHPYESLRVPTGPLLEKLPCSKGQTMAPLTLGSLHV